MIWRIFLILFFSIPAFINAQVTHQFTGQGDGTSWHDTANWSPASEPSNLDDVVIPEGFEVIITQANTAAKAVTIEGQLTLSGTTTFQSVKITTNALLEIQQTLTIDFIINTAPSFLFNLGTVNNSSTITVNELANFGHLNNSGKITAFLVQNRSPGLIDNIGELECDQSFTNESNVVNTAVGQMELRRLFNHQSFTNNGFVDAPEIFNEKKLILDLNEPTIINSGRLKVVRINNDHLVENNATGTIQGFAGRITNNHLFNNRGALDSMNINNSGTFINFQSGTILTVGENLLNNNLFENEGNIQVGLNNRGSDGIHNDGGTFRNKSTGTIELVNLSTDALENNTAFFFHIEGGTVQNEGRINANLSSNIPTTDNSGTPISIVLLFNEAGTFLNEANALLNLTGQTQFTEGIRTAGQFTNNGAITIGNTTTPVLRGIVNQDSFINTARGTITMDKVSIICIDNDAFFENQGGSIQLGLNDEIGAGISNSGTFNHLTNGEAVGLLQIQKSALVGISSDAIIRNNALIEVGKEGDVQQFFTGISSTGASNFINQMGGQISIENVREAASSFSGNLSNAGQLIIEGVAQSINATNITNEACGLIAVDNTIKGEGTFTNNGFLDIRQTPANPHELTPANFINNAIVKDPFATITIDSITNDGIIIAPVLGRVDENPLIALFEIGNLLGNYTFGPAVSDTSTNQVIGNFADINTIDLLTPFTEEGNLGMLFAIKDDDNECIDTTIVPLTIIGELSCSMEVTDAFNGANNGAIDLTVTGGAPPLEFLWLNGQDTFTTKDLSNLAPGDYEVVVTDSLLETTTCQATVSMTSQPKICGEVTKFWDGGATVVDEEVVFLGDGINWNDPLNWSPDGVPGPGDVVATSPIFDLPEGRDKITLNVDATIEAGFIGLPFTIPGGRTFTYTCKFTMSGGNLNVNGKIIGNSGEMNVIVGDFINNGEIEITGIGVEEGLLHIGAINECTNNGTITVDNLAKGKGILLSIGFVGNPAPIRLENKGGIFLKNGGLGINGGFADTTFINQATGEIFINNTSVGIAALLAENFGTIEFGTLDLIDSDIGILVSSIFAETRNFINRPQGTITMLAPETGIQVAFQDTFINEGTILIGESPNTTAASSFQTGIVNEGFFVNEGLLNISNFTQKGIVNVMDRSQLPANRTPAIFINADTNSMVEIAGNLGDNGAATAEFGVVNENGFFENQGNLFIKDIRQTGIDNFAHPGNEIDVEGDVFLNDGLITINSLGLGLNNVAAQGIQNRQHGFFNNQGEILIGTTEDTSKIAGAIKGVGIYLRTAAELSIRDSSRFFNRGKIQIDNIVSGGELDGVETGHGILAFQIASRHITLDSFFINEEGGELLLGQHQPIQNSGIRLENTGLPREQVFLNRDAAKIEINQTGEHGIHLGGQRLPTNFHNKSILEIGNRDIIGGNGILVDNGFFKHFPNQTMHINNTLDNGIEIRGHIKDTRSFPAIFENEGIIRLGDSTKINGNGLFLTLAPEQRATTEAIFNNKETGVVAINNVGKSGIKMEERLDFNDGTIRFSNENIIDLGAEDFDPIPEHGIDATKSRINLTSNSNINIDNVAGHGIKLAEEDLSLRGVVTIGTNKGIGQDGMHITGNNARIFDRSELSIKNVNRHGICVEGAAYSKLLNEINMEAITQNGILLTGETASFTNSTNITIEDAQGGIFVEKEAIFQNNAVIDITRATRAGICTMESGTFNNNLNSSEVAIQDSPIGIENRGDFTNFDDAHVNISNFQVGIFNVSANNNASFGRSNSNSNIADFLNLGILEIKNNNPSGNDDCLINAGGALFRNGSCGEARLFGKFTNPDNNTIFNSGFFRLKAVAEEVVQFFNEGTITNNGFIEDAQIRLDVNSVTNNEKIGQSSCLGDNTNGMFDSPIQVGDNGNFTIESTWNITSGGSFTEGDYDPTTNQVTFPSPRPTGSFMVSFKVKNIFGSCEIDADATLAYEEATTGLSGEASKNFTFAGSNIPADAGPDQIDLCETTTNLASNTAPAGAQGNWSFVDAGDDLGVIEDVNNPNSEFSGTFGQSYILKWRITSEHCSGEDEVQVSFEQDSDEDTVCDPEDRCPGGDDRIDFNDNGIPDECEFDNANEPCTEEELTMNEGAVAEGTHHAIQRLVAAGRIAPNAMVAFKAGASITLQAGFHAEAGSNFTAAIESCSAVLVESEPVATVRTESPTEVLLASTDKMIVENVETIPAQPTVHIFPNPVRQATKLAINLPTSTTIRVHLFDLNGRKVATLVEPTELAAGRHAYEWQCDQVEAGMYLVVLNGVQVGKLAVIR